MVWDLSGVEEKNASVDISPSASFDLSKLVQPKNELEVFYGLARDVKFCKICNMSNQQPMSSNEYAHSHSSTKATLSFDEHGVCHACNFNTLKETGEIGLLILSSLVAMK